jgi:hypothetical protein
VIVHQYRAAVNSGAVMNNLVKSLFIGVVSILLILFWTTYIRSPEIEVIIPKGYIGEVFIAYGDKSPSLFSNKYQYDIGKNGLFISEYGVPRGRMLGTSFCFTYVNAEGCLPVVYGDRAALLKKKENKGIVVMAPTFTGYRKFRLPNDSIVDFSNGYISAVVDSLSSQKVYDRNIKTLFEF